MAVQDENARLRNRLRAAQDDAAAQKKQRDSVMLELHQLQEELERLRREAAGAQVPYPFTYYHT